MLAGTPILVAAQNGADRGGVRRDHEGHLWIAHWTATHPMRVAGTRLEGLEPGRIGGPNWWIVGGRLPHGAEAAVVRGQNHEWSGAATGHGAWVAFVPGSRDEPGLPPVRFLDRLGALVSRAASADEHHAAALDSRQAGLLAQGRSGLGGACPACGRSDWRMKPGRADSGHVVFCAACGHSDGAVYAFYGAR